MSFLDGISKHSPSIQTNIGEGLAASAYKQALNDPPNTLANPNSPASLVIDAGLKSLGAPAEYRALAAFSLDPQRSVREALLDQSKETMSLIGRNKTVSDAIKIYGDAAKTPGGFGVAAGFEERGIIIVGGRPANIGANLEPQFARIDPTHDTSFTLPNGARVGIGVTPNETGGKFCSCELPDGSKLAWHVLNDGQQFSLEAMALSGRFAGQTCGVLFGPFGNVHRFDGPLRHAPADGLIDAGQGGGRGGAFDALFNRNTTDGASRTLTPVEPAPGGSPALGDSSYQGMLDTISGLGREIDGLKQQLQDPTLTADQRMAISFQMQEKMQERMQMITMLTNLLKSEHDSTMAVVNNFRL